MTDGLALHVLASGSRGNACVVERARTGAGVLVDCGICKRDFLARCAEAGFDPARIEGVLITHEHTDHVKGLGVVLRGLARLGRRPCVYAAPPVARASREVAALAADGVEVRALPAPGEAVSVAGIDVTVLPTSHDAAFSCGFRFEADGDAAGLLTDTGRVLPEAHTGLCGVRVLALEANHDAQMLACGSYPYPVRQRIASDEGHLSNEQAADELAALLADARAARLERVVAMHVSQNNNDYRLPVQALAAVVRAAGVEGRVRVETAYQDRLTSVR